MTELFITRRFLITCSLLALLFIAAGPASLHAQTRSQKQASELIQKQARPVISPRLLERVTAENSSILVSISKQRVYLLMGKEVVIDSPISSGKRRGMTPTGSYTILQKNRDHRSNIYGDFVDGKGRVVRRGVSAKIDSAPSGTRFSGASMKYFLRLTWDGIGLHVGHLPGYPASHGCIRLPEEVAFRIFEKVALGTRVQVVE